jgi:hypothetical protein
MRGGHRPKEFTQFAAQARGLKMSWSISGKEFENVVRLAPRARYEHFVKKVADWKEVWSLWKDGWVLMGDKDENETVPVWPHPMYAEASALGEWLGYTPRKISLDDWLQKWTPGMAKDRRMVAVFPTNEGETITVDPFRLKADLQEELSKYESS